MFLFAAKQNKYTKPLEKRFRAVLKFKKFMVLFIDLFAWHACDNIIFNSGINQTTLL